LCRFAVVFGAVFAADAPCVAAGLTGFVGALSVEAASAPAARARIIVPVKIKRFIYSLSFDAKYLCG
jgi:hypothetical protein